MIYETLYDWQKNVVDKFKHKDSFGLFLDMGLGKTPLSLAFAEVNNCTKVIVITINSKATEDINTSGSWFSWASKSDMQYKLHNKWGYCNFYSNDLLLINYESIFSRAKDRTAKTELKQNIQEFINSCKGHNVAIIVDESHKMKNNQSQQTRAILQIKRKLILTANNVFTYLLSGTPFTTGYIDLYTQLKMLGHEGTKTQFIDNFCVRGNVPGLLGWQQPIVGYKNTNELYKLVHKYALTMKSEDVVDLPEKLFVYHPISLNKEFELFTNEFLPGDEILKENAKRPNKLTDAARYQTTHKVNNPYFRNIAYPDLKWLADTSGTFWMRARQLSIGFQGNATESIWFDRTRLDVLKAFLSNNEDNYLLFYNFTPELLELYDICEELGYNVDVYCGEIKSLAYYEKYESQTEAERLTNKKNIILANFASGSTGMNWQLYNKCIIFSIPVYKDWAQGLKRIHRLGQKSTCIYHFFYQKNWLDYSMKQSLETEVEYNHKLFEDDLKRINQLITNDK